MSADLLPAGRYHPGINLSHVTASKAHHFSTLGVLEKQQDLKMLNIEEEGTGLFFNEEYCYDENKSGQVERGLNIYTIWFTNYGLQGLTPMYDSQTFSEVLANCHGLSGLSLSHNNCYPSFSDSFRRELVK